MDSATRRGFLKTTAAATALAAASRKAGAAGYSDRPKTAAPKIHRPGFAWPKGKRVAVSMSFDDARPSQVDVAFPLLEECGVKATFYVCPDKIEKRRDKWRALHAAGHELGNHTVSHPCSGNFHFSRSNALEHLTLEDMETEMLECNRRVEEACGVTPATFAYPCGNTFVGRGAEVRSYVPLVAKHFLAGRGFPSEWHNAPAYCDRAQLNGIPFDQLDFERVLALIERARADGGWLVLAGHDAGDQDVRQVTRCDTIRTLCAYAQEPDNGVWLDTVATVAAYVRDWEDNTQKGATEDVSE